ncbi:MAG: DUF4012 domain-containing protein [Streptomycetales bacterium]
MKTGRRLMHGRRPVFCAGVFGLLFAGLCGWLALCGWEARADLLAARSAVTQVRTHLLADQVRDARSALGEASEHTAAARRATSGPVWELATRLPLAGRVFETVAGLSVAADELTRGALSDLVRAWRVLDPATLQGAGGKVDLARLRAAGDPLADAARQVDQVDGVLAGLPPRSGVAAVDKARATLEQRTTKLGGLISGAVTATRVLPPLLGGDGPRRYFLAVQNNAEARGTGGLVGAYAIVEADDGQLRFLAFGPNGDIAYAPSPVVDLGTEFRQTYAPNHAARLLSNSNLSPHFPYAAAIWTHMWERQTGQHLDGAIATDPVGLSQLLAATGPVMLPDGQTLTPANAVALTEQGIYARYPDPAIRDRYLVGVARTVAGALLRSRPAPLNVAHALQTMISDGRLAMWSSHSREQRMLVRTGLGAVLPVTAGPYAHVVINNAAGNKLDYYLDRSVRYRLDPCHGGRRKSTLRVRLTNSAPATGLPYYVTQRNDEPPFVPTPGATKIWVSIYTSVGARLREVTLDGHTHHMSEHTERRHPVYSTELETPPAQGHTLTLRLTEPATTAPPRVPVQPMARPQHTKVTDGGC